MGPDLGLQLFCAVSLRRSLLGRVEAGNPQSYCSQQTPSRPEGSAGCLPHAHEECAHGLVSPPPRQAQWSMQRQDCYGITLASLHESLKCVQENTAKFLR